jgi:glycine cleavage system H protein
VANVPDELRYTPEHEWAVLVRENIVRIGITDYAQASLGDIVFVSVHDLQTEVVSAATFGEVESTKSVSDLYAPVSGRVVSRNEALDTSPELVNNDPYGDGWIAEIAVSDASVLEDLLDAAAYRAVTAD